MEGVAGGSASGSLQNHKAFESKTEGRTPRESLKGPRMSNTQKLPVAAGCPWTAQSSPDHAGKLQMVPRIFWPSNMG